MELAEAPHADLCRRCRNWVRWPSLRNSEKAAFAAVTRKGRLEGARHAQASLGLDLDKAKLLAFHVSERPTQCHRCEGSLEGEVSKCGTCGALNLIGEVQAKLSASTF